MKRFALFFGVFWAFNPVMATTDEITVDDFTMLANSDCKELFVDWNNETEQLEIEFKDHNARTNAAENIVDVMKRCNIRITLGIQEGHRIAVGKMKVAYDGSIAKGGQGYTALRFNFAGLVDDGFAKNLPDNGPFTDTIAYAPEPKQYTRCGSTSTRLDLRSKVWVTVPSGSAKDSFVSFENGAGEVELKNPTVKIVCGVVIERCGG